MAAAHLYVTENKLNILFLCSPQAWAKKFNGVKRNNNYTWAHHGKNFY